jgi:hypothetical protein
VGLVRSGIQDVLIFDPATTAVLEREAIAVDPARIPRPSGRRPFRPGQVISYTVYRPSGMVAAIGDVPAAGQ